MTSELSRRMAAWLLMLPGPWLAPSRSDALRLARRAFDPRVSDDAFERALSAAGYAFVAQSVGGFTIQPLEADVQRAA